MSFICVVSESVFTAYSHSNRGDVLSFPKKIFRFSGTSTVVFRFTSSGGVFRSVSGKVRALLAVKTLCRFGNFIRIS